MTDPGKKQDQPKDPRGGYHSGPFPEQVQDLFKKYAEAYASGQNVVNLKVLSVLGQ